MACREGISRPISMSAPAATEGGWPTLRVPQAGFAYVGFRIGAKASLSEKRVESEKQMTRPRIIGILLLIGFLGALAIGIMKIQSESKRTQMFSCLSSVAAFLDTQQRASGLPQGTPHWSALNRTESDRL